MYEVVVMHQMRPFVFCVATTTTTVATAVVAVVAIVVASAVDDDATTAALQTKHKLNICHSSPQYFPTRRGVKCIYVYCAVAHISEETQYVNII